MLLETGQEASMIRIKAKYQQEPKAKKKKKNHNVNNKEITAKNLKLTSELPLPHPHSQYPLLECPVARKMLVKTGHILSWLTPRAVGEISPLRTSSLPGQMGSHCRGIGVASEK